MPPVFQLRRDEKALTKVRAPIIGKASHPQKHFIVSFDKLQERLNNMSPSELASLHMYLTMYIIGKQQNNQNLLNRASSWLVNHGFSNILGLSILDIDKIRRITHKTLIEKTKQLQDSEYIHIERKAPFKIPDIENLVLSLANKIGEQYYNAYITIDNNEISIYWDNTDEEETAYGEPTQLRSISIEYIPPFMGEPPKIVVNAEIADKMEDLELEFEDIKELDEQELFQLLEKYPNAEISEEAEHVLEEMKEYGEPVEILASNNPKICNILESEIISVIKFPNNMCVALLPVSEAGNEYTKAWIWRRGVNVKVKEYEKIREKTGLDLKVDRIYHEYPAEYDAGAPGNAIVHASGTLKIPIRKPEDELAAVEKIKNIIKGLLDI